MQTATIRRYLDDPAAAAEWLRSLGVVDAPRARANLARMAASGMTLDLVGVLFDQLAGCLAGCPDPDMALNNLDRFVAAARNPLSLGTLFQRDTSALPTLVQAFSNSQHLSDQLVSDPESFDLLRMTEGEPATRRALVDDLAAEIDVLERDQAVLGALRRFKYRETLRIAYGDIVRGQGLQTVTRQISFVADAIIESALRAARRTIENDRGTPRCEDGTPARIVVIGMGKLGGVELNYSSDIDVIFLYDGEGHTDGRRRISNREFFEQLARETVRLLSETTDMGRAYRVDLRLRPEGGRGPTVTSVSGALAYYDIRGRTWERQAYIKARPVAGDPALGFDFLDRMRPWIYRRYLSRADISGIKALKRRIERQSRRDGVDARNVKTGHGGIRDIEFVIQFLQLLNGADLPGLQTGNTLEAIAQLENAGCLNNQERTLLEDNYAFLRKIEHRLQIMFDLQTHLLPDGSGEMRKLALRMGYVDRPGRTALAAFEVDYRGKTSENRRILDHLLHDAFPDNAKTEAEVDLVLDPDPPEGRIAEVLGKYPFRDVPRAYRNLTALGEENIQFLSTRRCRHFLAAIAPRLLEAVAATPDPDSTLVNLDKVSASLGGKGVLWELFSSNPPSLRLYVELCAYSPYLCDILTSSPGMSDGLMDSLVLDKLPTPESLRDGLATLCRAAEDIDLILHSFKNDQQLRVGVRDLLGKEDIRATTAALSAIAQTCLAQIADGHSVDNRHVDKHSGGQTGEMVILAMGKFGGREMNYHSDLDVVFLYEAEGRNTTNQQFFSEWAQRIIKAAAGLGPHGRLYAVDARLRPTGKSGPLAVSLDQFARYFAGGGGRLWERQALCKARVVYGSDRAAEAAMAVVRAAAFDHPWNPGDADEIRKMRRRLEETASADDLKRGPGGIVDIEFLVQMLQLKHGRHNAALRTPNTLAALAALQQSGHLSAADAMLLTDGYRFLRTLEGRLRLTSDTARDKLPEDPTELAKLAHLLHHADGASLLADYRQTTRKIRRCFDRIFDAERG